MIEMSGERGPQPVASGFQGVRKHEEHRQHEHRFLALDAEYGLAVERQVTSMSQTNKQPDMVGTDEQVGMDQHLVFSLAGEMYAIKLLGVKEIIEYGNVTPIPTMPDFIRGVINLRGRVLPVMDLSARFGEGLTDIGDRTCIVVLEQKDSGREQDMGVVVDSVNAVVDIASGDLEPAPSFGARIRVDFIQGMWKHKDRFLVVLDLARVLSVEEIVQLAARMQDETGH